MRDVMQFLLRMQPATLLPSYSQFTDADVPAKFDRFKEVWRRCAARLQVGSSNQIASAPHDVLSCVFQIALHSSAPICLCPMAER